MKNSPANTGTELPSPFLGEIYQFFLRLCSNEMEAEELCKILYIQIETGSEADRIFEKPESWFFKQALAVWKKVQKKPSPALNNRLTLRTTSPTEWKNLKNDRQQLLIALEGLSSDEKIILVLKDMLGKSYEDISEILEMKQNSLRSILARARENLREQIYRLNGHIL